MMVRKINNKKVIVIVSKFDVKKSRRLLSYFIIF